LNLQAVIGFNGTIVDGLILHPDKETIIFPIGNQIVVRNALKRQDQFLKGHSNYISSLTLSSSGCFLASGQKTFSGFKADIITSNNVFNSPLFHPLIFHSKLLVFLMIKNI
jgi:hypothetical protein